MLLSELIRNDTERIIWEWEEFAKTLSAGVGLPRRLLRVHASEILQSNAQDIETPKLPAKQEAKVEGSPGPLVEHVAAAHVNLRIESGFDLAQIMAEYRALRACVLRLWRESDPAGFAQGGRGDSQIHRSDRSSHGRNSAHLCTIGGSVPRPISCHIGP
jgi:hypothetical protein